MHRARVKICGVSRVEDALAAARAGADAVGMVLYPRVTRSITVERARQIATALPPFVTPVILTVDERAQTVLDMASRIGVRQVQLQGHETPEDVAALEGVSVIKAIRVTRGGLEREIEPWSAAVAAGRVPNLIGIVLDTGGTGHLGGSGVENDWSAIADAQTAGLFGSLPPIIAAGGLRPETVANVVRTIRPWAVDVSSGVESLPGQKSPEKIAAFIGAVRGA
jgi:phosphoribosylanthranilate isomerase